MLDYIKTIQFCQPKLKFLVRSSRSSTQVRILFLKRSVDIYIELIYYLYRISTIFFQLLNLNCISVSTAKLITRLILLYLLTILKLTTITKSIKTDLLYLDRYITINLKLTESSTSALLEKDKDFILCNIWYSILVIVQTMTNRSRIQI